MAERFENLDNILRDWAKERYDKQEEEKNRFFFRKWLRKNAQAVSVGSRARWNQKQTGLSSKLALR